MRGTVCTECVTCACSTTLVYKDAQCCACWLW